MEVVCYRTGGGEFPENTIEGIQNCYDTQPDWWIEMDLRFTKDGQVVLVHDPILSRLAGKEITVKDANYKELEFLNIGWHYNPVAFASIPLLITVFEQFRIAKFVLDIHDQEATRSVVELVQKFNMEDKVVVVSESDHVISKVKKLNPLIHCGAATKEAKRLLVSSILRLDRFFPLQSDLLVVPTTYKRITVISNRILQHVRKRNKKIWIYAEDTDVLVANRSKGLPLDGMVHDRETYDKYESIGVDVVFTDRPKELFHQLQAPKDSGLAP